MRPLVAALFSLGFLASSPAQAGGFRDSTQRLNAMRLRAPQAAATSARSVRPSLYKPVRFSMEIGDHVGRAATVADVKINQGLDGRTPAEALAMVHSKMT